eukprot:gene6560-7860_t
MDGLLLSYIYISVLAGRNLPTENTGLYFAAFCNILVNSSPDATCSTETLTTDANPVWGDGDIKTFRYYPGITKYATIEVCDGNVVGHNVLGQVRLGELQVRVDWGYLAKPALLLSQRPSYRKKLGSLKVEVKVKVEGCEERTTTVQNCLNPHFFEAFEFDVTEIISNLMVEAWDEDFIDDDDYFGMISIPIEGMTELQRPQKLAGHQGTIRLALTLTMTARAPEMYMGQMLMYYDPLEYPASYDTERLWVEVGRLVDVLVAPITSSLLCLLYLQSWGSPMYNMLVIVYTVARYKFFGAYAVQLLPLTLILDLCGIGKVASDAATVMDPFTNLILPPFMTSILESLTYVLHTLISTTNSLERVANILVWKDTSVSLFTGWLLLLSTGMLCAVWTMLLYAWARIPFGLSEVLLCSKLFAVLPVAFATKEFVLGIDMLLLQLRDGDYGVAIPVSTMLP